MIKNSQLENQFWVIRGRARLFQKRFKFYLWCLTAPALPQSAGSGISPGYSRNNRARYRGSEKPLTCFIKPLTLYLLQHKSKTWTQLQEIKNNHSHEWKLRNKARRKPPASPGGQRKSRNRQEQKWSGLYGHRGEKIWTLSTTYNKIMPILLNKLK